MFPFGKLQRKSQNIPRAKKLKVKEVIKRLEAEEWIFDRQKSSHRTYKKIGVADIVTVSGIDSKDVSPGQLQQIKRKARWK